MKRSGTSFQPTYSDDGVGEVDLRQSRGAELPIELMVAHTAAELPDGRLHAYAPKFEWVPLSRAPPRPGRAVAHQRSLTRSVAAVADAVAEHLPAGTVVDGQLILLVNGRVDFSALQRRTVSR